jgi:hypothetical protein
MLLDTMLIDFTIYGIISSVHILQLYINVSARSQSVGLTGDNRSPKRQPRTPLATTTQQNKMNGPVQTERRPRPSKYKNCAV